MFPVQIGLLRREPVQIPLPGRTVGLGDPGPGAITEESFPVIGWLSAVRPLAVAEEEPLPPPRARTRRVDRGPSLRYEVDEEVRIDDGGVGIERVAAARRSAVRRVAHFQPGRDGRAASTRGCAGWPSRRSRDSRPRAGPQPCPRKRPDSSPAGAPPAAHTRAAVPTAGARLHATPRSVQGARTAPG